ncbi:MAG: 4Fe-4S dicluster domain-containing protein [Bacteriovoracia bacterium]
MDNTKINALTSLKADICIILQGVSNENTKDQSWTPAAIDFLRALYKSGLTICLIGPRPNEKFGSRKNLYTLDRHKVISLKVLKATKKKCIELRVINKKSYQWMRVRADVCVTIGLNGIWPTYYEGWTTAGTMSMPALSRWVQEQKWLPGREIVFVGSSNQSLRWACQLLDRGAKSCYVVESSDQLKCWRSYRDRLLAKGGRVFLNHQIIRTEKDENQNIKALYLRNDKGTLIVNADTVVLCSSNEESLNAPDFWKKKLYYVQRRDSPWDFRIDEERWLEQLDFSELYWRICKDLELTDYAKADRSVQVARADRKRLLEYRNKPSDLKYSGKILDRESMKFIRETVSVPKKVERTKPVASLECLQELPCTACVDVCPDNAIEKKFLTDLPEILEDKCTGCGACVSICPSGAAVMLRDDAVNQKAHLFLAEDSNRIWKPGDSVQVLNRKGDALGVGKVVAPATSFEKGIWRVLEVETSNVYTWEARAFRPVGHHESSNLLAPAEKKGWIYLNGVKRLAPIGVKTTTALWQLGMKRFEDALFCDDGSCRLCEVIIDGKPSLSCQTQIQEGMRIDLTNIRQPKDKTVMQCPCKNISVNEVKEMQKDGCSFDLIREQTGFGYGKCHGQWCLSSLEELVSIGGKRRPVFPGYLGSPWFEVWSFDVLRDEDKLP